MGAREGGGAKHVSDSDREAGVAGGAVHLEREQREEEIGSLLELPEGERERERDMGRDCP